MVFPRNISICVKLFLALFDPNASFYPEFPKFFRSRDFQMHKDYQPQVLSNQHAKVCLQDIVDDPTKQTGTFAHKLRSVYYPFDPVFRGACSSLVVLFMALIRVYTSSPVVDSNNILLLIYRFNAVEHLQRLLDSLQNWINEMLNTPGQKRLSVPYLKGGAVVHNFRIRLYLWQQEFHRNTENHRTLELDES